MIDSNQQPAMQGATPPQQQAIPQPPPGELPAYDVEYWKTQITLAKKNQKKFQESGRKIYERYLAEAQGSDDADTRRDRIFNLFWANTGILESALYGNTPRPTVDRTFQDPNDDIARVAAEIMRRLLISGDEVIAFYNAVKDRLIPGLGQTWFRYDASVLTTEIQGVQFQQIQDESVRTDYVHWQDFFWSPCRVWSECKWVARRVWMEKAAVWKRFPNYAAQISYVIPKEGAVYEATRSEAKNDSLLRAEVFEIWCLDTRTVHWISPNCDHELDKQPDPLKLRKFFPCPRPLAATVGTMKFMPRADFSMVQDQYQQLDELNVRIGFLIDAVKVVGVYDKTADGVQRMLNQAVDNQLIPVDNWAMFAEKGGIKGQVDWLPLEQVVAALDKLRQVRQDIVQQIYELTGISDIMRGVTNARETFGAQKLKAQYSSSRLQLYQGQVAEFVTEGLEIKAEIISKHFQPQTLVRKSQIDKTPDAQFIGPAVQLLKNSYELMFRIKISNTQMSIPDYNAEKQDRMEYVTAMGQFVSQITPLVQAQPQAAPFFLKILSWAGAAFQTSGGVETLFDNFVREVEKKLMTPPPPKEPTPQDKYDLASAQKAFQDARKSAAQTLEILASVGLPVQLATDLPPHADPTKPKPQDPPQQGMPPGGPRPPMPPQGGRPPVPPAPMQGGPRPGVPIAPMPMRPQ